MRTSAPRRCRAGRRTQCPGDDGAHRVRAVRPSEYRPTGRRRHRHERQDDDRASDRRDPRARRGRSPRSSARSPARARRPRPPICSSCWPARRDARCRRLRWRCRRTPSAQHRVDGTRFAAAVFTNLSADHLDYHRTMEEYFKAKARLFEPSFTDVAVIDVDTPYGRLLAGLRATPGRRAQWRIDGRYALGRARSIPRSAGATRSCTYRSEVASTSRTPCSPRTPSPRSTSRRDDIAAALATSRRCPVASRRIDEGQPFTVLVDYAHTPDGLEACARSSP